MAIILPYYSAAVWARSRFLYADWQLLGPSSNGHQILTIWRLHPVGNAQLYTIYTVTKKWMERLSCFPLSDNKKKEQEKKRERRDKKKITLANVSNVIIVGGVAQHKVGAWNPYLTDDIKDENEGGGDFAIWHTRPMINLGVNCQLYHTTRESHIGCKIYIFFLCFVSSSPCCCSLKTFWAKRRATAAAARFTTWKPI